MDQCHPDLSIFLQLVQKSQLSPLTRYDFTISLLHSLSNDPQQRKFERFKSIVFFQQQMEMGEILPTNQPTTFHIQHMLGLSSIFSVQLFHMYFATRPSPSLTAVQPRTIFQMFRLFQKGNFLPKTLLFVEIAICSTLSEELDKKCLRCKSE